MTWFAMTGDERILRRCATENCGGQPTWRLEAGGVGSDYCSGCKAKIETQDDMYLHGVSIMQVTGDGVTHVPLSKFTKLCVEAAKRIAELEGSVRAAIAEAQTIAQSIDDPERVKMLATNLVDFLRKDLEADMTARTPTV